MRELREHSWPIF